MERVIGVCWCWLCVIGGYESSHRASISLSTWSHAFLPVLMSSDCGGAAQSPMKRQMSSSATCPSKYRSLWWHPKKKRRKKRKRKTETVHLQKKKKKKLQDGGGVEKGTKGNEGWTDLEREN